MLFQAVRIKKRIIQALVFRIIKAEYGTTGISYLSALIKPLLQIVFMSAIFTLMSRNLPLGNNYTIFIASGVIPLHLCLTLANRIMSIAIFGKPLIKHPMVTPLDISFAALIVESGVLLIVSILVFLTVGLLGFWDYKVDSLLIILTTALFSIGIGFGVGLINLAMSLKIQAYPKIWQVLSMPLFIASGVFYISERIPPQALEYLYYNPLLHITDSMRSGLYRTWDSSFTDYSYVTGFMFTSIALGLFLQRITENKIRDEA